jgi:hypothetical protein
VEAMLMNIFPFFWVTIAARKNRLFPLKLSFGLYV